MLARGIRGLQKHGRYRQALGLALLHCFIVTFDNVARWKVYSNGEPKKVID